MKAIIIIILFVLCVIPIAAFSQSTFADSDKYTQFPKEYQDEANLIKHIIPDKNYTYWELVGFSGYDLKSYGKVLFTSGEKPVGINFVNPKNGFTFDCPPGICYKYIAYVYNGQVGYITQTDDFVKFMGSIDNLEEAALLAEFSRGAYNPLRIANQKKGGAYLKTETGYEIIVTHGETCPVSLEAIKLTIDKTGILKQESLGVYYKSTDCYKI